MLEIDLEKKIDKYGYEQVDRFSICNGWVIDYSQFYFLNFSINYLMTCIIP